MTPDFHEDRQTERRYHDTMAAETRNIVETPEHKAAVTQWLEEKNKVVPEFVPTEVQSVEWNDGHMTKDVA